MGEEIAKQLVNLAVEKGGKSPDEAKKVVDQAWLYPHMEMAASMGEVFQAKLAAFKENPEPFIKAAFKLMDTNYDGHLVLEEVRQCLSPLGERHIKFQKTMGLYPEDEEHCAFNKAWNGV